MLSVRNAKCLLRLLIPVFVAVFSVCVLSAKVPETGFVQESLQSVEASNQTVMEFAGATLGASVAISALPDDFGTPLANALAEMNKYFVFILMALFLEKLLVVEGIRIAFVWLIPIACGIYIIACLLRSPAIKGFACRVAVLALALALVVPCSTHFVEAVGGDYLAYVEETIAATAADAEKVNDLMMEEGSDKTIFEKLSDSFKTAIHGVNDFLEYSKNGIRKCMNSIAILIVVNFVMPVMTFLFFRWLLNELFRISLPPIPVRVPRHHREEPEHAAPRIEETV